MQKRTTNNKSDRVLKTPFFYLCEKKLIFLLKNLKSKPPPVIFNIEKDNFTSVIGRGYWGRVKI